MKSLTESRHIEADISRSLQAVVMCQIKSILWDKIGQNLFVQTTLDLSPW